MSTRQCRRRGGHGPGEGSRGVAPGPVTVTVKTRLPPGTTLAALSLTEVEDVAWLTDAAVSEPEDPP